MMRAEGTFEVVSFVPAELDAEPPVTTALPVGTATMLKDYDGEIVGHSTTVFTAAFDQSTGSGTYVAMESFEGSLQGVPGTFNFVHSASTTGRDRSNEYFLIVPSSGTGDLSGISGGGGLSVDGAHRIWFEYDLTPAG
jgi:hypothetical protein